MSLNRSSWWREKGLRRAAARARLALAVAMLAWVPLWHGVRAPAAEGVFLDTDSAAAKALGAARELIANRQWGDVIDLVRQISEQHPDRVVQVEPGRYVNVAAYCNMLLAALPPEGLKLHRAQVDDQARRWYGSAVATGDDQDLERIVKLAFHSSWGDEALLLLGDRAWERGDVSRARAYWEKLLPVVPSENEGVPAAALYYPNPDCDLAQVRARLVLASLMLGQIDRGRRELEAFRKLHPQASAVLAGRSGNLAETLAGCLQEAQQRQINATRSAAATFGGNPQRNQVEPQSLEVGTVRWSVPLREYRQERPPQRVEEGFGRWWGGFRPMAERPAPGPPQETLSYYPVVSGNVLYYCDETAVYAWNLFPEAKAEPAWGSDPVIYRMPGTSPAQKRSGWARFTVSVDQGRLFARMGRMAPQRAAIQTGPPSALVCLDLAREGDLAWLVRADEVESSGGRWVFDGAPLAAGGRVFATLRRSDPQMQLNVACFDAETGRLLWNRKVCIGVEPFGRDYEDLRNQLLTLADDALYFNTNAGAIAALDLHDGGIRWVVTYAHTEVDSLEALDKRSMHGPNPCVVHDGVVYAAPYDSERILALDAGTGMMLWERVLEGNAHQLVGVARGRLVAAGDKLWALDAHTGRVAWHVGRDAPDAVTHGRGLIAGDMVYWPRREEILVVEAATGRLRRSIDLSGHHHVAGGGNLLVADGLLVAAQAQRLLVFGEYGALKQQHEDEVARRPHSAAPPVPMGLVEEATGRPDQALDHYLAALERAAGEDLFHGLPLKPQIASRAARQLRRQLQEALERQDLAGAARLQDEVARLELSADGRDQAWLALADILERAGQPAEALAVLQRIIDAHQQQAGLSIRRGQPPGTIQARWEMGRILDRHGRRHYEPLERQAEREIAAARAGADDQALARVVDRFWHSRAAARALAELARRHLEAGNGAAADRAYKQLLEMAGTSAARLQALQGLIDTARQRGFARSAEAWRALRQRQVASNNSERPAGRLPPQGELPEAENPRAKHQSLPRQPAGVPALPLPVERLWRKALAPGEAFLVPGGISPRQDLALLTGGDTLCLDVQTGETACEVALHGRVHWAGFSGDALVAATGSTLAAVAPDTGQVLWWRSLHALLPSSQPASGSAAGATRCAVSQTRILAMGGQSGLLALTPEDGLPLWSFQPAQGVLNPHWCVADDHVVVQTNNPDRTFVLSAATGRVEAARETPGSVWISDPVVDRPGQVVCMTAGARPEWLDLRMANRIGNYTGPVSFAHAQPQVVPHQPAPLVLIDGNTLALYEDGSFARRFSLRTGSRPLADAMQSTAEDTEFLYVAADGIASAYSLKGPDRAWQAHLGPRDWEWRLALFGESLVAWPAAPVGPFWAVVLEPATGKLLARLNFARANAPVAAHRFEQTLVLDTGAELHAFRAASTSAR